jgi:hypothetical protein
MTPLTESAIPDPQRLDAVMVTLHNRGYYAPDTPWGKTAVDGFRLIPQSRRHHYAFAAEQDYLAAFGDTLEGTQPRLVSPLRVHWAGDGNEIATIFYSAEFFVRWSGQEADCLYVGLLPFDHDAPVWAPTDWARFESVLRVLQTKGYDAPLTPTDSGASTALAPLRYVVFGLLEQTLALTGKARPAPLGTTFVTALLLTWQGDGSELAHIFHRAGFRVWGHLTPETLMGIAPADRDLSILSPHFPPWHPTPP